MLKILGSTPRTPQNYGPVKLLPLTQSEPRRIRKPPLGILSSRTQNSRQDLSSSVLVNV